MTDKPMIFSASMVRALLDGRKSQTRRIIKPQPPVDAHMVRAYTDNAPRPALRNTIGWFVPEAGDLWPCNDEDRIPLPYAPGDQLWVREAHAFVPASAYRNSLFVQQRIDSNDPDRAAVYREGFDRSTGGIRWRPSIHMPRWASRLTLVVKDVRVQRVQEISGEDCIAEGVECQTCATGCSAGRTPCKQRGCFEIRENFRALWNDLQSKSRGTAYSWEANPWVVALTFTVHRCNIDQMEAAQ